MEDFVGEMLDADQLHDELVRLIFGRALELFQTLVQVRRVPDWPQKVGNKRGAICGRSARHLKILVSDLLRAHVPNTSQGPFLLIRPRFALLGAH
jgi:hypothetical protein